MGEEQVRVVAESEVLKGATMSEIQEAGTTVRFKERCVETLQALQAESVPMYVLSANWSGAMIKVNHH